VDSADAERFLSLAQACLPHRRADCWEDLDPAASSTVDLVTKVLSCLEAPSLRPENPYVGLRPFEAADADRYFGREDVVADLVDRVQSEPVVLLVGGSGSGKSSIVRAGLVPHLRRLDPPWTPTVMVPGARPMQHLAHALQRVRTADAQGAATDDAVASRGVGLADAARRASGRLVLVVDQLEELFTVSDPGEREQFLAVLAQCAQGLAGEVRVVATVRADYFDQPLDHAAFGGIAARAALPVPPMSAADLDRSVLGPASGRLRVDEGLAADLVSAVVGQPGALPALQFTLRELADRGGHELRRDDLVALGGVDGAIAHRAEQMYAALDPAAQQTLRQVLQRLVVVDDAGEPSRRSVPRAELAALATGADDLVEEWVSGRLLTTGRRPDTREPTVTLAHEAVLTRWPRLRDWVDEDRERLLAMARLTQAAQEWADLGKDPGALPRGGRLEQAEQLARTTLAPPVVQQFVAEGQSRRVEEHRQAAEAAAAEQRTSRRLRRQRWMLAVALVVAIAVGWVAIDQRGAAIAAAEQQRRRADAGASSLIAASNEAALSDWSRALLLAVEAHRLSPSPDTERNMLATLLQWRPIPTTVWTSEESLSAVTLDPVRRWGAVRWASGPVDVVDLDEGVRVRGIQARGAGGLDLHDGTLALASIEASAGTVVVLDDHGNRVVASLPNAVQVTDIEFRPDGEVVAIADSSGAVQLLDTGLWEDVGTLSGPDIAGIQQVTWGESGDSLYAFDAAGVYLDWDTTRARPGETLEPVARRPTTERAELSGVYEPSDVELVLVDLRVVPGEDAVVAVDESEALVRVDTDTQELVYLPSKSRGATVLGGALTDEETQVVADGSRMWVISRRPGTYGLVELSAEWNAVDVDGLDDGTVVTVGSDGNVTTWLLPYLADPPGSEPVPALDDATVVALAPNGRSLLTWDGATAQVLDGSTFTSGATLDLGSSMPLVLGAAFVPGVDRLVVHTCASPPDRSWESCDSFVTSYATDGTIVAGPVDAGPARPSHGATVVAAADVVATVDSSGTVTLRDPLTLAPGERLRVPDAPDDPDSSSLSMSPHGGLLALTSLEPQSSAVWRLLDDPVLLVHDTASGAGDPRFDAQNLAFNTYTSFYGALSLSDESFAVGQRDAVRVFGVHRGATAVIQDPWREGLFESEVVQRTALSSGADAVMRSPSTTNDSSLMMTGEPGYYWLWDPGRPSVVAGPIGVDKAVLDPTGDRLFLWRGDEAFVLSLHPDDLVAAACAAAGRTLTEQEWSRSIGAGEPYAPACPG
jgi:WD40 repeat protein